jgi:hypothetical protein
MPCSGKNPAEDISEKNIRPLKEKPFVTTTILCMYPVGNIKEKVRNRNCTKNLSFMKTSKLLNGITKSNTM